MEKIPPFKPGDKVVFIAVPGPISNIQNNVIYTVDTIWYCCTTIPWRLTLIETNYGGICGKSAPGYAAKNFRKIDDISEHTVDSLLEELQEPVIIDEIAPIPTEVWESL